MVVLPAETMNLSSGEIDTKLTPSEWPMFTVISIGRFLEIDWPRPSDPKKKANTSPHTAKMWILKARWSVMVFISLPWHVPGQCTKVREMETARSIRALQTVGRLRG